MALEYGSFNEVKNPLIVEKHTRVWLWM